MGNSLRKFVVEHILDGILAKYFGNKPKREARILILGLDAAGKTTILYRMKLGKVVTTTPTIGFNVETINYKDKGYWWRRQDPQSLEGKLRLYSLNIPKTAALLPGYKRKAIMYVIDGNDRERLDEAMEYLSKTISEAEELHNATIIILLNKQDLPGCISRDEFVMRFRLDRGFGFEKGNFYHVQPTSAIKGDGIWEALEWLSLATFDPEFREECRKLDYRRIVWTCLLLCNRLRIPVEIMQVILHFVPVGLNWDGVKENLKYLKKMKK